MEVRLHRLVAVPVLLSLVGLFMLTTVLALPRSSSIGSLFSASSSALVNPELSLKFSSHGLLTDISSKTPQSKDLTPAKMAQTISDNFQTQQVMNNLSSTAQRYHQASNENRLAHIWNIRASIGYTNLVLGSGAVAEW